jgi:hypothetical protein
MLSRIAVVAVAFCLSSCAPAVLAPVQGAADLVQSVGSTGGFWTIGSTTKLNGADADLATAQTRLTLGQYSAAASNQQRLGHERIVTAHLLRQMAKTYDDPLLGTLAEWVEGGGDPDFSFKYALVQVSQITARDRSLGQAAHSTLVVPPVVPKVKTLAQSPRLSGPALHGESATTA